MPAPELRIANRAAYFRKAVKTPAFGSESVLTRDVFQFVDLWLVRHCKDARPLWRQARNYYLASRALPPESAPLTLYYCFLNAAKALLIVKGEAFSDQHGVAGSWDPTSNRVLSNAGYKNKCVLRTKKRARWRARGSTQAEQQGAVERLQKSHQTNRLRVCYISAGQIFGT
jgi:hypothetical protein